MPETPTPDQTPTAPEAPTMIPLEAVAPLLKRLRRCLETGEIQDIRLALLYDRAAATCGLIPLAELVDLWAYTGEPQPASREHIILLDEP